MDLKKLSISDQFSYLGSSPRRRIVVSGFGLFLASSFIFLCILLLNYSFKSPFLSPVFSGFSYSDKSTLISWPFSSSRNVSTTSVSLSSKGSLHSLVVNGTTEGSIHEGNLSRIVKNGNLSVEESGNFSNFSGKGTVFGEKGEAWGNTHVENFFENVKNGSFVVQESGVTKNTPQLNGSHIDGNITFSNFSGASDIGSVNSNVGAPTYFEDVVGSNGERKKVAVIKGKGGLSVERNGGIGSNDEKSLTGRGKDFYGDCDIFDGEWVRDDTKPHYPLGSCPIIDRDFDCHLNKRPDDGYIKWRWQPYACDIPSLNATDFLERLRGQKLVFVGDSLNRNMWESLVCILRHSIRDKKRVYEISGRHEFKKKGFYAFRFEDYNCSVDFVSSPFLVRQSAFKGKNGSFETLRLDLMEKTTSMYSDADIVIFNTGHWWGFDKFPKETPLVFYKSGQPIQPPLEMFDGLKSVLENMIAYIEKELPGKTLKFWRLQSPRHFQGGDWNQNGSCTVGEPLDELQLDLWFDPRYNGVNKEARRLNHLIEEVLKVTNIRILDLTHLSEFRADAHPAIWLGKKDAVAVWGQDCMHWCLPGVPDTWVDILAQLINHYILETG